VKNRIVSDDEEEDKSSWLLRIGRRERERERVKEEGDATPKSREGAKGKKDRRIERG